MTATLNDILVDTQKSRAESARQALLDKRDATTDKMQQTVSGAFLKAAQGLMGLSPHGKRGLQLLTPYFGIAALSKAIFDGIRTNADLTSKLGEGQEVTGPGSTPANSPEAPTRQAPTGPQMTGTMG